MSVTKREEGAGYDGSVLFFNIQAHVLASVWARARAGGLGINERKDGGAQGAEPGTRANHTSQGGIADLLLLPDELTSLTLLKGTLPAPH